MRGMIRAYDKNFGATPTIIKGDFEFNAFDIVIVPLSTNTGSLFLGDQTACTFPIPSTGISIGDLQRGSSEEAWNLDDISIRASVAGEGAHILLTGTR